MEATVNELDDVRVERGESSPALVEMKKHMRQIDAIDAEIVDREVAGALPQAYDEVHAASGEEISDTGELKKQLRHVTQPRR